MMRPETSRVGKRGSVVIPAKIRRRYQIEEGTLVTVEEREEGLLIRPAVAVPIEFYSPERKAELLLSNAVDQASYEAALEQVRSLGLDPTQIAHRAPDED